MSKPSHITDKPSHLPNNPTVNHITPVGTIEQPTKEPDEKTPHGYRPGRLSQIEILERIFPFQKRPVLELVLQGCNGDLVKAIEHFLSAQDTLVAQHQHIHNINSSMYNSVNRTSENTINSYHPYMTAFNQLRPNINSHSKLSVSNNLKSAFTPLSQHPSPYTNMHMALNQRNSGFSSDSLMHKLPSVVSNGLFSNGTNLLRPGEMLNTPPGVTHAPFGFGQFPLPLTNSSFGFPPFLPPHRPFTLDTLQHSSVDKNSDRTDSDRASDSWTESPGKDSKDSLE